jgi:NAD/NADP transhydrogenase alpha subunit
MPTHASLLFSRNLTAFVQAFTKDKVFQLDLSDDIQKGSIITHASEISNLRTKEALKAAGL